MSMDQYELASLAAINDLEGDDYHKLTVKQQRELFGANILGRKSINFDPENQGTVRVTWRTSCGTDMNLKTYSYEQFAQMVTTGQAVEE